MNKIPLILSLAAALAMTVSCDSGDSVISDIEDKPSAHDGGSGGHGGQGNETPSNPDDECINECDGEDMFRCDETGEYVCGYFDDDPCLEWSEHTACVDGCDGDRCKCVDECDKIDAMHCDGRTGYQICQDDDGDGCLKWSPTTLCGPGTVCDNINGGCIPGSAGCLDDCAFGSRECAGSGWRECKDIDGDGCSEWTEPVPCDGDAECIDGRCIADSCTDQCAGGTRECSGNGWRECKDIDGDGCTEWSAVTPCADTEVCSGGKCAASCSDQCTKGEKQCSAANDAVRTCDDYDGDGCTEWGADETCKFGCADAKCKPDPNAWVPPCSGADCPIVVTDFSKQISGDTSKGRNIISKYAGKCSGTNEAGPEQRYVFKVDEPGTVIIGTTEPSGGDVDVHLLSSLDADGCLARGDKGLSYHVGKGVYYAVADTFEGAGNAGAHKLKITFLPDSGKCGLVSGIMNRINSPKELQMPATGRVVQEAHLVTDLDQKRNGSGWWPSTKTEGLSEHSAQSQQFTGIGKVGEWCPSGEGGCRYGQGCTGRAVPWKAEAYYVCMYWTGSSKPKPGTRFLVVNPVTGDAVVTAAGYETGPGDGNKIGGAVYEVHKKLGTRHDSTLTFGELRSQGQGYEYGPINCD